MIVCKTKGCWNPAIPKLDYCSGFCTISKAHSGDCCCKTCLSAFQEPKEKAVKHDQDKPRMELIPTEAMQEMAKVLTFGAIEYGDRNWELGMDWSRVYGALQRHLTSWWANENEGIDEESGLSHMSHALCCVSFLVAYEARDVGVDDREGVKE